jgi:predicted AlkP superfamily pyrophosphatase or phosphodiesterase
MRKLLLLPILLYFTHQAISQNEVKRPKLVVGIVIDQMRWDFLYRYYDRFDNKGGFKRMLGQGFSCENTMIPYTPTVTACGHSCIYTGAVPANSGITGNIWWDRELMRTVYCVEDKSVNTIGSSSVNGQMSPKNMLVTSIADELRLATNFGSKVIGVALKDRGAILPAGHSANAAYWYDASSGNWISSSYYMADIPGWVKDFNARKIVDQYYREGWKLSYPASTYGQSTADERKYEANLFGPGFPYDLTRYIGKDYAKISSTPMGNAMTTVFAKAAIENEQLGKDNITDLLAVSYSSTDYIGHSFGPNSIEAEDAMLKLDKDLGAFMDYLDTKLGKGQYLLFLSADHGVSHIPEFLSDNKLPGGRIMLNSLVVALNKELAEKYSIAQVIVSDENYQLHLNNRLLDSASIDRKELINRVIKRLNTEHAIERAFAVEDLNKVPLPEMLRTRLNNGYYPRRNGDIQMVFKPGYIEAFSKTGTTHGLWNPYDSHIPLLWFGWGIKAGKTNREVYMTDIAPTLAAMLHIQMPNGCIGQVITELTR